MTRTMRLAAVALIAAGAVWMLAGRHLAVAAEEVSTSEGPIKILDLPLEGAMAGKLYFEINPKEPGAPSAFKVDVNNWAAIEVLTAARASQSTIRVSYKADFSVTEIEVLEAVKVVRPRR